MPFVYYQRPNATRAAIIDDLLEMVWSGQQGAVSTAIVMLTDLFQNGHHSSYAQKMKGVPLWELKSHARGGAKGGVRVYFYFRSSGDMVLVNAEIKPGDTPNATLLREATLVALNDTRRKS